MAKIWTARASGHQRVRDKSGGLIGSAQKLVGIT